MLTIQAHWTLLVVAAILTVIYFTLLRVFKRKMDMTLDVRGEEYDTSREKLIQHLDDKDLVHKQVLADLNRRTSDVILDVYKRAKDLVKQAETTTKYNVRLRDVIIKGMLPSLRRTAHLRTESEEGEEACVLLHIINSMGLFTLPKEDGRLITKGQSVSGRNPSEVVQAVQDLALAQIEMEKREKLVEAEEARVKQEKAQAEKERANEDPLVVLGQGTSQTEISYNSQ